MGNLRVRRGEVQTSIREYANPETGSTIGLVGTIHVGSQDYYDGITKYVQGREANGSVVHYEWIKNTPDLQNLDPEIAELAEQWSQEFAIMSLAAKVFGLTKQHPGIRYGSEWKNYDLNLAQVAEALGKDALNRLLEQEKRFQDSLDGLSPESQARLLSLTLRAMPWLYSLLPRMFDSQGVLIPKRNAAALDGIDTELSEDPNADLTLIWGSIHLPGISGGIENRGYKQTSVRWLGAFSLKNRHIESDSQE